MDYKRGVRIATPILMAFVLYMFFIFVNGNPKSEVNNVEYKLDSLSVAIMSVVDHEEKVEVEVEDEIIVENEIIKTKEDIENNEELEVAAEDNIHQDKNLQAKDSPSRGTPLVEGRNEQDNSLQGYLNNYVLDSINDYKIGSENPYLLNNDYDNYNGVTENVVYDGELLLKSHSSGKRYSHCTGITFEVFFKAMQQRNRDLGISADNFNSMSSDELHDFILTWYVAKGSKSESNLTVAIEKYGLGRRITNYEDVRPGDFIDLSRENNTGHAVIFINWIRESGKIIGIKHWSSQGSTNGISFKEEYFNIKNSDGVKYGNVIYDNLHIARVNPVDKYKAFK